MRQSLKYFWRFFFEENPATTFGGNRVKFSGEVLAKISGGISGGVLEGLSEGIPVL